MDFSGVRDPVFLAERAEELFESENVIDSQESQAFFTEHYFVLNYRPADDVRVWLMGLEDVR